MESVHRGTLQNLKMSLKESLQRRFGKNCDIMAITIRNRFFLKNAPNQPKLSQKMRKSISHREITLFSKNIQIQVPKIHFQDIGRSWGRKSTFPTEKHENRDKKLV